MEASTIVRAVARVGSMLAIAVWVLSGCERQALDPMRSSSGEFECTDDDDCTMRTQYDCCGDMTSPQAVNGRWNALRYEARRVRMEPECAVVDCGRVEPSWQLRYSPFCDAGRCNARVEMVRDCPASCGRLPETTGGVGLSCFDALNIAVSACCLGEGKARAHDVAPETLCHVQRQCRDETISDPTLAARIEAATCRE